MSTAPLLQAFHVQRLETGDTKITAWDGDTLTTTDSAAIKEFATHALEKRNQAIGTDRYRNALRICLDSSTDTIRGRPRV